MHATQEDKATMTGRKELGERVGGTGGSVGKEREEGDVRSADEGDLAGRKEK